MGINGAPGGHKVLGVEISLQNGGLMYVHVDDVSEGEQVFPWCLTMVIIQ